MGESCQNLHQMGRKQKLPSVFSPGFHQQSSPKAREKSKTSQGALIVLHMNPMSTCSTRKACRTPLPSLEKQLPDADPGSPSSALLPSSAVPPSHLWPFMTSHIQRTALYQGPHSTTFQWDPGGYLCLLPLLTSLSWYSQTCLGCLPQSLLSAHLHFRGTRVLLSSSSHVPQQFFPAHFHSFATPRGLESLSLSETPQPSHLAGTQRGYLCLLPLLHSTPGRK